MEWYDELYVGESIRQKEKKVRWQINIYVITLASNPQNLLDIIPSHELLQKGYPKKGLYVIGLAKGYDEAVDVAVSIIDEVFHETGAFEVAAYLKAKSRGRRTVT